MVAGSVLNVVPGQQGMRNAFFAGEPYLGDMGGANMGGADSGYAQCANSLASQGFAQCAPPLQGFNVPFSHPATFPCQMPY